MTRRSIFRTFCTMFCVVGTLSADSNPLQKNSKQEIKTSKKDAPAFNSIKAFTGKILGKNVRVRQLADIESPVIAELLGGELVSVIGERSDFYAISAPNNTKAFVFRSFIIDEVIEGKHVHVRLKPDLTSPVIGYLNTGDKVDGIICDSNHKWLQISPPKNTVFYIAKEFIENIGGYELKAIHDAKKENVTKLMQSTLLFAKSEMSKSFEEINFNRITNDFETIINDYKEFPEYAKNAKEKFFSIKEDFLRKKLAYLESKADKMSNHMASSSNYTETSVTPMDRMNIWEANEESIFISWSNGDSSKTKEEFYEEEKMVSKSISGIVEVYSDFVKNKPGSYVLRDKEYSKAYLYSTKVNLNDFVGRYVNLTVVERPNNDYAYPAYFVVEAH